MRKGFIIIAVLFMIFIVWLQPLDCGKKEIIIPKGANGHQISDILAANHVLRSKNEFLVWLRILGKEKELRFGDYELYSYKNPIYLINELTYGHEAEVVMTIPEGLTIDETASLLANKGLVNRDIFIHLCHDDSFIKKLGLNLSSLEGYLFPDTYFFSEAQGEAKIIQAMVNNFKHHVGDWGAVDSDSFRTILVVASLVEKEAKYDDERPLVAGVFFSRLKNHQPLESCATVVYALKYSSGLDADFTNLSEKDLQTQSLYNTYLHQGLPPGPICSPGENSIKAALSPAVTDYLYFVLKGDGHHHFSRSYKEHLAAKDLYHAQN